VSAAPAAAIHLSCACLPVYWLPHAMVGTGPLEIKPSTAAPPPPTPPPRLKRAGLDYWPAVCVDVHPSWQAFLEFYQAQPGPKQLVRYSKLARQHYASDGLYSGTATWLMCAAVAAAEVGCHPDGERSCWWRCCFW
jgi:hypothetical protein